MVKFKDWLVTVVVVLSLFSACQGDVREETRTGKVNLTVTVEEMVTAGSLSRSTTTQLETPDWGEFSFLIMEGDKELFKIEKLNEWNAEMELPVGSYKAIAYYGDVNTEGFEAPYFFGEVDVTILPNQMNQVAINCALANTLLTFEYGDSFTNYFSSNITTVKTALGNTIVVDQHEERYLYAKPGNLSITMDVTRQGGETGYESVKLVVVDDATVKAKTHYNFRFDVNAGGEMLEISFDDQVVMQPIDISTIHAAAPKFTLTGIEQGENLLHPEFADKEITALLAASSGIAKVKMQVRSSYLASLGLPQEEIDLTDPINNDAIQLLQKLGVEIRGLSHLDRMVWFDFTNLLSVLQCLDSDGVHTFTLHAIDRLGKTCEDMAFTIQSVNYPIEVTTLADNVWNVWDKELCLALETAGDATKVKAYLATGQEVNMVTQSIGLNHYNMILSLPGNSGHTSLRFQLGSSMVELGVSPFIPPYSLSLSSEWAVWAKQADLLVSSINAETATNILQHLSLQAAGIPLSFQTNGNSITVTNLTPGQHYTIVPHCAGVPNYDSALTITTEQALQLPNAGMEDWYYTRPSGVNYWEVWYAAKEGDSPVWNTLNLKTTSEGGTTTGAFNSNRNAYRYNANSGTLQTDDCHTGRYAALIRAVGWGKGNSAYGSANAKYGDPGYLFLGSYNAASHTPTYDGIPFNSRPSALSFYHKYAPGNGGDSYLAEIVVLSKEGDHTIEIGKALVRGAEAINAYQQVILPISYNEAALSNPVTHLHLLFKSGDRGDNASFVKVPSLGNLSTGEYVGSQLYIDDITLIYE